MTQDKTQPMPNHYVTDLPKSIGGYQHIEHGPTAQGDIWVHDGLPRSFVDVADYPSAEDAENVHGPYGWHIYRKMPVPSSRDDKALWGETYDKAVAEADVRSVEEKPSNPKDAVGSNKVPLHLWPTTASALGSMALLDGMLKYGRTNYRVIGVRSSIYYDAMNRHMNAWFEGEDTDLDSGLPHLAHALACIAVIVDAQAAGKLNDDRVYPSQYRKFMSDLTPHVARLKEKHKALDPKHFTIADAK